MKDEATLELAKKLRDGQVVGVGTGTTVEGILRALVQEIKRNNYTIYVVPTSLETTWLCESLGLKVLSPGFSGEITWGFDGADAVNEKLWLIKGKGGALLQEKILATRCKSFTIVIDEKKLVSDLSSCSVPLEIIPEARSIVEDELKKLGTKSVTLRSGSGKNGPVVTEAGNIILDVNFKIIDESLEKKLKSLVGVVESGLFINYADEVIVRGEKGIRTLALPHRLTT